MNSLMKLETFVIGDIKYRKSQINVLRGFFLRKNNNNNNTKKTYKN